MSRRFENSPSHFLTPEAAELWKACDAFIKDPYNEEKRRRWQEALAVVKAMEAAAKSRSTFLDSSADYTGDDDDDDEEDDEDDDADYDGNDDGDGNYGTGDIINPLSSPPRRGSGPGKSSGRHKKRR